MTRLHALEFAAGELITLAAVAIAVAWTVKGRGKDQNRGGEEMGLLDKLLGTKEELDEREEPVTKIDQLMMKHEGKKDSGTSGK